MFIPLLTEAAVGKMDSDKDLKAGGGGCAEEEGVSR